MRKTAVLLICVLFCANVVPIVAETDEITAARLAGENDATVFKWKWLAAGCLTASVTPVVVALAYRAHNELIVSPADAIELNYFFILCGACTLIPTAIAIIDSPTPPPERLLGKSPEWVKAYSKAYKRVTRRHRIGATLIGSMAGGAVFAATLEMYYPFRFFRGRFFETGYYAD